MSEQQRRDLEAHQRHGQETFKRDLPSKGQHEKQETQPGGHHQAMGERHDQKPKTERASHQGGGGVRGDHKPQGTGTR